jgi:hypothetical protein
MKFRTMCPGLDGNPALKHGGREGSGEACEVSGTRVVISVESYMVEVRGNNDSTLDILTEIGIERSAVRYS